MRPTQKLKIKIRAVRTPRSRDVGLSRRPKSVPSSNSSTRMSQTSATYSDGSSEGEDSSETAYIKVGLESGRAA